MSQAAYSGTGITQGPFSLSQGVTLTLNDPSDYSQPSTALQLQNNSGFTISVQSAGAVYNIMPFFAQTIPTLGGGQSITVTPQNPIQSAGNQTGGLTVVWLLSGQNAPIQDGALTPIIINSREQKPSVTGGVPPVYYYVYPLQATDQSMEFIFFPVSGSGYTFTYTITGTTSSHVYASGILTVASTGSTLLGAFQAFGSIDNSIELTVTCTTNSPIVQIVLFTGALNQYISNTSSNPVLVETVAPVQVEQFTGAPLSTYIYGGENHAYLQTTGTTAAQIVAAPASGYSLRIHSVSMYYTGTAVVTPVAGRFLMGNNGNNIFAALQYPYENNSYLGGLLTTTAIYVVASSSTNTLWAVNYDTVTTPSIA